MILVSLPVDNPASVWSEMTQHLHDQDISGAILLFTSESAEKYREAYFSIVSANLKTIIDQIPAISPVVIENDTAQYRFDQVIQGVTITFPIEFVKENGVWKIDSF